MAKSCSDRDPTRIRPPLLWLFSTGLLCFERFDDDGTGDDNADDGADNDDDGADNDDDDDNDVMALFSKTSLLLSLARSDDDGDVDYDGSVDDYDGGDDDDDDGDDDGRNAKW